jgi:hypothetical protein
MMNDVYDDDYDNNYYYRELLWKFGDVRTITSMLCAERRGASMICEVGFVDDRGEYWLSNDGLC